MTEQPNVVPFGKYKGRLIEELIEDDPGYLQWLASQDWFRARFVALHQVIINRGAEPEETPEHNALQVLFLDEKFCRRFTRHLYPNWQKTVIEYGEDARRKRIDELTASLSRERPDWMHGEQYQQQWDQARKSELNELAQAKEAAEFSVVLHAEAQFETRGVDVLLETRATAVAKNSRVWASDYLHTAIEIKPTVGDDYPAVLRQMRRAQTRVLFLEQYSGKGATRQQFVQTFKTANITVVFRNELAAQERNR
jgi:uncharacterized protein (DUF3820 family)